MLIGEEFGPWIADPAIGPLVTVKWNQEQPYNISIPGEYPVGCVMVAAAQVMSCTRRPIMAPGTSGKTYSWTQLLSVSNYTNVKLWKSGYTENTTPTQKLHTEYLSDMMYRIGDQAYFQAKYNYSGTSGSNYEAAFKLLDPIYYANVKNIYFNADKDVINKIYNCLDNSKPMIIAGTMATGETLIGAHAWVLDGYIKYNRKVTRLWRSGYTGPVRTEIKNETRKV